jgi:plastocyanin
MQPVRTVRVPGGGKVLTLVAAMALLAVACGGDDSSDTTSTEPPLVALSGSVSNHGTKDLGKATKLDVELRDLYFAPTFIKATPGTQVEISLENAGEVKHTFTIDETSTNVEIDAGQKSSVKVTLPAAGALAFYCTFHRGSGMQGAFSVSATTATAGGGATTTTVASSSGGYGY